MERHQFQTPDLFGAIPARIRPTLQDLAEKYGTRTVARPPFKQWLSRISGAPRPTEEVVNFPTVELFRFAKWKVIREQRADSGSLFTDTQRTLSNLTNVFVGMMRNPAEFRDQNPVNVEEKAKLIELLLYVSLLPIFMLRLSLLTWLVCLVFYVTIRWVSYKKDYYATCFFLSTYVLFGIPTFLLQFATPYAVCLLLAAMATASIRYITDENMDITVAATELAKTLLLTLFIAVPMIRG